jgi:purine-nucleoside phosphorylase
VTSPDLFKTDCSDAMTHDDAIVRPIRTRRSPELGPLALVAASELDVQLLRRGLDLPDSRPLYMSRFYYNRIDPKQPVVVGPIIGAPYAVMLLEVLRSWGVQKAFFIGWCGSIDQRVRIGDLIVPTGAWIDEGTSSHYGQSVGSPAAPDQQLQADLQRGLQQRGIPFHSGSIWTTDAIFRETRAQIERFQGLGALAVEMELSALFSAAAFYGFPLAALLTVSDELFTYQWQAGFKTQAFRQAKEAACNFLIDVIKGDG